MDFPTWSTNAVNLPEHADNAVHTDEGGRAAGFPGAVVAGTTVYAYLVHVAAEALGRGWVERGGAEVRFVAPVIADEQVTCGPTADAAVPPVIEARVNGDVKATLTVLADAPAFGEQSGDPLPDMTIDLGDGIGRYGRRAGDPAELYDELGVAHPAAWPVIGNRVTSANLISGPWVHVRSTIAHLGVAPYGAEALVRSTVTRRFETRSGDRAVVDVRVSVDGTPVVAIEHESIVALR